MSRFNIQDDSRKAMIWREPGSRYRAPKIVERDHYRGCWDSNERPNRPLSVRWGFRYNYSISRRNPTNLLCSLSSLQWVPTRYLWTITPACIEHDWCGVIWRVKPFHRWRGLLDHRT
ncbi:hypothetical protein AVEN_115975-1 [Araneus ventricosus]|uniref:Uncharacterized protein n=1 Tax=Araneus ventricosus TaxID=182803 RepID=A0A4Y2L8S1_ARAVE|nr:hypothetical protein AVEN_115975-1 [Araneus ventricosus]